MPLTLNVSQLNAYIRSILDSDENLACLYVTGEISNFINHYRTGHLYFSLKDEKASVKAVMFRNDATRLRFAPENGMRVVVRCWVSVFERDGVYQLYVEEMQPDGIGALSIAFEQLKKKLEQKGYFDRAHKKKLPLYPEKVGVITSASGAAVRDIVQVLGRRYPYAQVVLYPVQVQGESAPRQISSAIARANTDMLCDVLIVGRGGGSAEDLQAFNEEIVADAIYASAIPVISAVGHETDVTIADFTADKRAPTPSAAAELAVPDTASLLEDISELLFTAGAYTNSLVRDREHELLRLSRLLSALSVDKTLTFREKQLEKYTLLARSCYEKIITDHDSKLSKLMSATHSLNPMAVLTRGYTVTTGANGDIVKSAGAVQTGDTVSVCFADGKAICTVESVSREKGRKGREKHNG